MSRSIHRPDRDVPHTPSGAAPGNVLSEANRGRLLTRRAALKAMLGAGLVGAAALGNPLRSLAAEASKETTDALNAAQSAYDDAQAKLDAIASEYDQLNQQLNDTMGQIEQVQGQIDSKQAEIDAKQAEIDSKQKEIDAKQAEIDSKQDQLSGRVSQAYKSGNSGFLELLLNSTSFEELTSNLFYLGKINASDEQLIADVKQAKAEMEQAKADLEGQKDQLEKLKEEQSQQLAQTKAKQQEASDLLASLGESVRQLVSQRDAEILAAAEEERRQAEAAAAAAAAARAAGNGGASGVTGSLSGASASEKGAAIISASTRIGSPGLGLCAMWVSQVYSAAGLGYPGGNANDMYWNYCTSSNKGDLQPGMIIAVPAHSHTAAGRIYGHVGIYIGNGTVRHNIGPISTQSLDSWISFYGTNYTPRWGWAG